MALKLTGQELADSPLVFQQAQVLNGPVLTANDAPMELEPITARCVDGRDFAKIGKRSRPIIIEVYIATNNYPDTQRRISALKGQLVKATIDIPQRTSLTLNDVVISDVSMGRRTGKLYGLGEVNNNEIT